MQNYKKYGGKGVKNNQLFPFERNRYYSGKLLTSSDFEAEQAYMNGKRHFLNHIMFGSGVVCGLNVVNLDDLSVLIESGVAIDDEGNEIVVPSTVIKRLSVIEGYENLTGDEAGLFIRYMEKPVHSVYCGDVGAGNGEYENNRIDDEYEIYLKDLNDESSTQQVGDDVILVEKILDNEDYTITVKTPYTISKGNSVKIEINICKNSNADKELKFKAKFQLPAFFDYEGKHEFEVGVEDLKLEQNESFTKDYWVNVDRTEAKEANIIAGKENIKFSIGGFDVETNHGVNFKVVLSNLEPRELSMCEVGKTNLEEELKACGDGGVCIARISLIRTEANSIIGEIKERGVKRYIKTPSKAKARQKYMSYYRNLHAARKGIDSVAADAVDSRDTQDMPVMMTSGRLEIPLDVNMKKGDVCYSEEIMHGLGKGNVYVDVGVEFLNDASRSKNGSRNTIYGNPSLFDFQECMETETAVRVLNDKGSFQVAVKLLGEQKSIVVQLNWVAIKFGSTKDVSELQEDNRSIIPETPTVRIKAKESYYFNVKFNNMEPCRLSYELTEVGSGEIGADGMYTAPSKEGVYEIYIYCTDTPKISTYVYAIVSK
jgi:hypothetical protein